MIIDFLTASSSNKSEPNDFLILVILAVVLTLLGCSIDHRDLIQYKFSSLTKTASKKFTQHKQAEISIEKNLETLKTKFENGEITLEEYTQRKRDFLRKM